MSSGTATATLARILVALLEGRTWQQADLARKVGVLVPALRRHLQELLEAGVPLERQQEGPKVFWSVSKNWYPGGTYFSATEAADLLRLLARLPRSRRRDLSLARLVSTIPGHEGPRSLAAVLAPAAAPMDDSHLAVFEDGARDSVVVHMRYASPSRGAIEWRHVSVHRVLPGPPAAFVSIEHRWPLSAAAAMWRCPPLRDAFAR
jgi:predicted DNA-binding transcriptional regulator YafY